MSIVAAAALALLLQAPPQQSPAAPAPLADTVTAAAGPISASAGVAPDSVTVGDHFRAVVRVRAPAGATVDFPDFGMTDPVEALAPVEARVDSAGLWTATYRLVAWSTGDSMVAAISIGITDAAGTRSSRRIRVPMPVVRSVLPADSALHLPRPAKAVIPIALPEAGVRGWLLPVLTLVAILAAAAWLLLRRRGGGMALAADPRDAALAKLREIEQAGHLERGEVVAYHVRTSRVLREYLAVRGVAGEDQTSTEMLESARAAGMPATTVRDLEWLLRQGDLVKFSGIRSADRDAAQRFGAETARWIQGWPDMGRASPTADRARAA